jgi:metal-responsive CopG/Arc/MetJ family transcriptional regulator
MKRALVSLPDELFGIMKTKLKGKFGQNDSEIIRGIVIAYLSEHGYLRNEEQPTEEITIQEDMIDAIVETLEDKGIITGKEIDDKMRKRLDKKKGLKQLSELD